MYNFRETENKILKFWRENNIFEKSLALRQASSTSSFKTSQGKKRFVFFEGPPTANGRPGIHHSLARSFKDLYGRYKTMRGFYVLRKAGWDTHGLPVELEVEKELGFKSKKDIEKFGIAEFNKKAKESVWKYKAEWEEMTRRMGYWLDMDNPYITYENGYIESLWAIIKKIWDKKLLYLAHRVVHFCTRCGTILSSHEVAQGYKRVTDKSVTLKFKVKSLKFESFKPKNLLLNNLQTYILAWTTTPWTLPGNVALAVGRDIEYAVVKYKDEYYILAKELIDKIFESVTSYKLQATSYRGSDLIGLEYEPLFDIPALKSDASYKIYEADFVSTEEGTGIVHTAVMYGEDDYELGTKVGLPKIHTVDEQGKFIGVNPELDGKYVKDPATEELIIKILTSNNQLLISSLYEHDYPFCWRCDTSLLYYAKESWFIKMSAVNKQLLKNNNEINWIPEHIKEGRFGQWLKEGKDWAFSRERYWGTPLPIWQCQNGKRPSDKQQATRNQNGCGNIKVVGSVEELNKLATAAKTKRNTYYILRHGYTTRDEKGKMIISTDSKADKYHLTAKGEKQIQKSAELIKNNCNIDLIYSSPFIRTMESAEIVARLIHLKINKDDRLREIEHGGCEGESHDACPMKGFKRSMDNKPHEFGESWDDVRKRTFDFINEMESKYSGKNILIVSHGDPLWLLDNIGRGATGGEILTEAMNSEIDYPDLGELGKLDWRSIPRNKYGELDLHRPFIDSICLKCDQCGASMKKVPDLIDVWFDSGAMPYAQWHWPFRATSDKRQATRSEKIFKEQFPADFIVEAVDQTRGWFYTLLAISTLLGKGAPYKNVISLAHVLDEKGQKMSKSKGNIVLPLEVMDKFGADAVRWYFYTVNSSGDYKLFSLKDIELRLRGFITTLDNCVRFWELYANSKEQIAKSKEEKNINYHLPFALRDLLLIDQWILSKLNGLIVEVTGCLDKYDSTTAARMIEKFVVEDLSNWWLRRSRKRKEALGLLRFLLLELAKIIAPFIPFIAEDIHMRMHQGQSMGTESVHLHDWPKVNKKLINKKLEEEMEKVRSIVTAGLAVRKEKQIKVRQPLAKLTLRKRQETSDKRQAELTDLIKDELNVKEVALDENQKEDLVLDTEMTRALLYEGYARELIRQMQDMRKEAKYRLDDRVFGQWHSDDEEILEAVRRWSDEIKEEVLLSEFRNGPHDGKVYDVEKELELAPQKKVWIGIRK